MKPTSETPRPTLQVLTVLRLLLDHPTAAQYGLELSKQAGLATGTIYPILTRLEQAGWVVSDWETASRCLRPPFAAAVLAHPGWR